LDVVLQILLWFDSRPTGAASPHYFSRLILMVSNNGVLSNLVTDISFVLINFASYNHDSTAHSRPLNLFLQKVIFIIWIEVVKYNPKSLICLQKINFFSLNTRLVLTKTVVVMHPKYYAFNILTIFTKMLINNRSLKKKIRK